MIPLSYSVSFGNRPFFRNKGLKHRKPNWKIVEGQAYQGSTLDKAIEEIMKVIDK